MTPTPEARARLQQLLGAAELAPLRQRLRRAYAQAGRGNEPGPLRLAALSSQEADVLQSLSGRAPKPARSLQIDPAVLSARLQAAGLAPGLREALEMLDGVIVDDQLRAAAAAAWPALALEAPHSALRSLLSQSRSLGLLKRLAGGDVDIARRLCCQSAIVLNALPVPGLPRARLAAQCLGDAHALDEGRAVATLVLAVLRHDAAQEDAESARTLWASQGVAVNELARPVLTLNLPWTGAAPTLGDPQYWPLRRLLRQPPAWQVGDRDVFVCENPNLLALAADALGARCAPLACTDGMPAAAQRTLLQQLRNAGARLRYHGDFDWPGVAIGNHVMESFGAVSWRFGAGDYRQAIAMQAQSRAPLRGTSQLARWDADLAPAMQEAGCGCPEEAVFETLRDDLAGLGAA